MPSRGKPSLSITRKFSAPPEKVWRAWTDPEALKTWFHPGEGMSTPVAEIDLREGGRYHIQMRSEDGEENDVSGVFKEIVTNEKLVFTWAWKSTPERESLVTITLKPSGGGTELTLLHEGFYDEKARDLHEEGWSDGLGKLDNFLQE